jgi:hypothetical protein
MRPLWFQYPNDPRTYLIEDQYLVGRDLLVAPVLTEGVVKRRVYFPNGERWVDWWTGKLYEGGRDAEVDAPLDRLPLFAREGAVIPTQPVVQHTGEMANVPLTLTLVPTTSRGETTDVTEDSDDGKYFAEKYGRVSVTQLMNGGLLISQQVGDAARAPAFVEIISPFGRPKDVRLEYVKDYDRKKDRKVTPEEMRAIENGSYDPATKRLTFPLPAGSRNGVTSLNVFYHF